MRRESFIMNLGAGLAFALLTGLAACGNTSSTTDGGTATGGTTSTSSGGTTGATSTSGGTTGATSTSGGTTGGTTGSTTTGGSSTGGETLFQKYGAAVPTVVDQAVAGLLADCVEAPYFGVVGEKGHDSVARLKGCLILQFNAVLGDPGVTYPGVNSEGDTCEDMATIHKELGIPQQVFDQFITDLAGVLIANGVAAADVATLAPQLTGLSAEIVSLSPVYYEGCDGGTGYDGGLPVTDGGVTLYQKYGGAPAVGKIVDDAITGVLADCVEAPYFAVIGQTGHDSLDRLAGCLDVQFEALFGGPVSYPSTNVHGDACESMTAIHAGVGVPSPVFDQFLTDLAGVLTTDGISAQDLGKAAPAVEGLRSQVVQAPAIYHDGCDGGLGYNPDGG